MQSNLLVLGLCLLCPVGLTLWAQPVPHHFNGITVPQDQTVTLSLDGSVSGMFNLSGTIANQFRLMFDLYPVEASTNLTDWTRLGLLQRSNSNSNPLLFKDTNAAGDAHGQPRPSNEHI